MHSLAALLIDSLLGGLPPEDGEQLACQLNNAYQRRHREQGPFRAMRWLLWELLRSLPGFGVAAMHWRMNMLTADLKTAFRKLRKDRGVSLLNVLGLTLGFASVICIALFLLHELSYDKHHENANRIYRMTFHGVLNGNGQYTARSCPALGGLLIEEFPEVEAVTKLCNYGAPVFRVDQATYSEERVFWADSTFFRVFTAPMLQGDPNTALTQPNHIVLTQAMAEKYFGQGDPMGRSIHSNWGQDFIVAGVVETQPTTSHFHFDFLCSLSARPDSRSPVWFMNDFYTYVLLREGVDVVALEQRLAKVVGERLDPQLRQGIGISYEQFVASGGRFGYAFQPLTDIHLRSHLEFELEANGDIGYVTTFAVVALAILLLSGINYINLATARSLSRAREIAVRKTLGSTRGGLVRQFLMESLLLSTVSMGLALILAVVLLPGFSQVVQRPLTWELISWTQGIPLVLGFVLLLGLGAGFYPARVLAGFQPSKLLRGRMADGGQGGKLRQMLVIFQYTISIVLIIGVLVVRQQVAFIQQSNLGFTKDQVLIIKKAGDLGGRLEGFKQALMEMPSVLSVTNSDKLMGQIFEAYSLRPVPSEDQQSQLGWYVSVDADFMETYGIALKAGRGFTDHGRDMPGSVLINETAAAMLGYDEPVGRVFINSFNENQQYHILGVVRDFHYESMHQPIRPLIIFPLTDGRRGDYLSVKVSTDQISKTLNQMETLWKQNAMGQAFEYQFFKDHYAKVYQAENQTAQVFYGLSVLAVLIANLGLFGLSSYMIERRIKEIGVRKALGASFGRILGLLLQRFFSWVLMASVVACPLGYFLMDHWLRQFAYQSPMHPILFVIALAIAIMTAGVTVIYHALRTAKVHPVRCLRYE